MTKLQHPPRTEPAQGEGRSLDAPAPATGESLRPRTPRMHGAWSRGGLSWREIAVQLWARTQAHDLADRASLLSFYFLLALFPLLIVFSALIGSILASQQETYWRLLNYLAHLMPVSAFVLFSETLSQITQGAQGSQLSLSVLLSLWSASSGFTGLIEALNVAFEVDNSRAWWQRRLVAIALALGIAALIGASLVFLFASSATGAYIVARLPLLGALSRVSYVVRWLVVLGLLVLSLMLIYSFGPNLRKRHWQGVLPGAGLALLCWGAASLGLRLYLTHFGSLTRSYGSLAGVVALLFWLYASAWALLLGGELNALIAHSVEAQRRSPSP